MRPFSVHKHAGRHANTHTETQTRIQARTEGHLIMSASVAAEKAHSQAAAGSSPYRNVTRRLCSGRLPFTQHSRSCCLRRRSHGSRARVCECVRVCECFFSPADYLFGAVSVSATPGLSDTRVLQPTVTVMSGPNDAAASRRGALLLLLLLYCNMWHWHRCCCRFLSPSVLNIRHFF